MGITIKINQCNNGQPVSAGFHRICEDLLADLAKQIAAVEQNNINSNINIPSTSSHVQPAVA